MGWAVRTALQANDETINFYFLFIFILLFIFLLHFEPVIFASFSHSCRFLFIHLLPLSPHPHRYMFAVPIHINHRTTSVSVCACILRCTEYSTIQYSIGKKRNRRNETKPNRWFRWSYRKKSASIKILNLPNREKTTANIILMLWRICRALYRFCFVSINHVFICAVVLLRCLFCSLIHHVPHCLPCFCKFHSFGLKMHFHVASLRGGSN